MSIDAILAKHAQRIASEREARIEAAKAIFAAHPDLRAFAQAMRDEFGEGVKCIYAGKIRNEEDLGAVACVSHKAKSGRKKGGSKQIGPASVNRGRRV